MIVSNKTCSYQCRQTQVNTSQCFKDICHISEVPRKHLITYFCAPNTSTRMHKLLNKLHIVYAIYVPSVSCKVPGCLYAAYGQYLRPASGYMDIQQGHSSSCSTKYLFFRHCQLADKICRTIQVFIYSSLVIFKFDKYISTNMVVFFIIGPFALLVPTRDCHILKIRGVLARNSTSWLAELILENVKWLFLCYNKT